MMNPKILSRSPARLIVAILCALFLITQMPSQDPIVPSRDAPDADEGAEKQEAKKPDVLEQTLKQQSDVLMRRVTLRVSDMARTLKLEEKRLRQLVEGAAAVARAELERWSQNAPADQALAWGGAPRPPAAVVIGTDAWKQLLEKVLREDERARYEAALAERRQRLLKARLQLMIARLDVELMLSDEQRETLLPVLEKIFTRASKSRSSAWRHHLLDGRDDLQAILSKRQMAMLVEKGR